MTKVIEKCRNHLSQVEESYWEHFFFAAGFSAKLIYAALAVLLHALIPAICEYTGSKTVMELCDTLRKRAEDDNA